MEKQTQKRPYGFWNWGTGITLVIIVAATAMIFLVYKSMNVKFEMAEENYYAEELKVNDKKAAKMRARQLSEPVVVQQTEDFVFIQFPQECRLESMEGTVKFYRPSAQNKDLLLPLKPDSTGKLIVPKERLIVGQYKLIIDWTMKEKNYLVEEPLYLEKTKS